MSARPKRAKPAPPESPWPDVAAELARPLHRHKFGAVRTERDGHKFSSKAEARYYDILKAAQEAGEVSFFLMQVPFHLPGSVRYVCDFAVFHASGVVEFVDVKGMATPLFTAKKRLVEALYPVTIEVTP